MGIDRCTQFLTDRYSLEYQVIGYFTDYFSGPGRALRQVCVSMQTVIWNKMNFGQDICHPGSP